tara:strand:+ start:80 stop:1267 length:1188 start_codon:yes stop_codon:yes gene_type:complete
MSTYTDDRFLLKWNIPERELDRSDRHVDFTLSELNVKNLLYSWVDTFSVGIRSKDSIVPMIDVSIPGSVGTFKFVLQTTPAVPPQMQSDNEITFRFDVEEKSPILALAMYPLPQIVSICMDLFDMDDYFIITVLCRYRTDTWYNWITYARESSLVSSNELLKLVAGRIVEKQGKDPKILDVLSDRQLCIWIDQQGYFKLTRSLYVLKRSIGKKLNWAKSIWDFEADYQRLLYEFQSLFEYEIIRLTVFGDGKDISKDILLRGTKTTVESQVDLLNDSTIVINKINTILLQLDRYKVKHVSGNPMLAKKVDKLLHAVSYIYTSLREILREWVRDSAVNTEIGKRSTDRQTSAINNQTMTQLSTSLGLQAYNDMGSTLASGSRIMSGAVDIATHLTR